MDYSSEEESEWQRSPSAPSPVLRSTRAGPLTGSMHGSGSERYISLEGGEPCRRLSELADQGLSGSTEKLRR